MPLGVFQTALQLVTRDEMSKGVRTAEDSVKSLDKATKKAQDSFSNLAGAYTKLLVAGYAKRAFQEFTKPAIEFEVSQKRFQALTKASTQDLAKFTQRVKQEVTRTPYDLDVTAEAMLKLRQATGKTEVASRGLGAAANLAMASFDKTTIQEAAGALGEVSRTFKGVGLQEASDKMIKSARAAGIGVEEYIKVMGRLGAANVQGAQSFDQVVNAYSLMRGGGWSAMRASNMLIRTLGELQEPKAQAAFGGIGVSVKDAVGNLKGLDEILVSLYGRYKKMPVRTMEAVQEGLGRFSQKAFLTLLARMDRGLFSISGKLLRGGDALKYLQREMGSAKGVGEEFSQAYRDMAQTQLSLVVQNIKLLAQELGKTLLPAMTQVAKATSYIIGIFTGIIGKSEILQKIFKGLATAFVAGGAIWAGRIAFQGLARILAVVSASAKSSAISFSGLVGKIGLARGAVSKFGSAVKGAAKWAGKFFLLSEGLDLIGKGPTKWARDWEVWFAGIRTGWEGMTSSGEALLKIKKQLFGKQEFSFWDQFSTSKIQKAFLQNQIAVQVLKKREKAIAEEKKAAEKQKEAAKSMDQAFAFGYRSMSEVLSRTEKLMSWEPPVIKEKALVAVQKRMQALRPTDVADQKRVQYMTKYAIPKMRELVRAGTKRDLTTQEYALLSTLGQQVGVGSKMLEAQKLLKKGTGKMFTQDVLKGISGMGSETTRMAMGHWAAMAGGRTKAPIKGWSPTTGGYEGAAVPYALGVPGVNKLLNMMYQGPTKAGPGTFGPESGKLPQSRMPSDDIVAAFAKNNMPMAEAIAMRVGKAVADALEGHLRHSSMTGPDPMVSDSVFRPRPFGQSR